MRNEQHHKSSNNTRLSEYLEKYNGLEAVWASKQIDGGRKLLYTLACTAFLAIVVSGAIGAPWRTHLCLLFLAVFFAILLIWMNRHENKVKCKKGPP
jgi:Flp pilus assembly protein TadB